MAAPDIHILQVRDAAVAGGHGDVLELGVAVVFCFEQFAAVDLAVC